MLCQVHGRNVRGLSLCSSFNLHRRDLLRLPTNDQRNVIFGCIIGIRENYIQYKFYVTLTYILQLKQDTLFGTYIQCFGLCRLNGCRHRGVWEVRCREDTRRVGGEIVAVDHRFNDNKHAVNGGITRGLRVPYCSTGVVRRVIGRANFTPSCMGRTKRCTPNNFLSGTFSGQVFKPAGRSVL